MHLWWSWIRITEIFFQRVYLVGDHTCCPSGPTPAFAPKPHFHRLIPANAREQKGYKGRPNPVIKRSLPTGPLTWRFFICLAKPFWDLRCRIRLFLSNPHSFPLFFPHMSDLYLGLKRSLPSLDLSLWWFKIYPQIQWHSLQKVEPISFLLRVD